MGALKEDCGAHQAQDFVVGEELVLLRQLDPLLGHAVLTPEIAFLRQGYPEVGVLPPARDRKRVIVIIRDSNSATVIIRRGTCSLLWLRSPHDMMGDLCPVQTAGTEAHRRD